LDLSLVRFWEEIGLSLLSNSSEEDFKMSFNPYEFLWQKEGTLFLVTIFVGFIAALIPAVKAYNLSIFQKH
jgi:putative ABC transport system permease protein